MTSPIRTERHDDVLVIISNSPPVNALGAAVREGLVAAIAEGMADASVTAMVIRCDGKTFFAGADITEFGKPPVGPMLPVVVDTIEAADKPVVAAIHGTALGGGLEVALACHYRAAIASAKLGVPEVKLGLLPTGGAGASEDSEDSPEPVSGCATATRPTTRCASPTRPSRPRRSCPSVT